MSYEMVTSEWEDDDNVNCTPMQLKMLKVLGHSAIIDIADSLWCSEYWKGIICTKNEEERMAKN